MDFANTQSGCMYFAITLSLFLFPIMAFSEPKMNHTDCNQLLQKLNRQQLAVGHFEDYGGGFSHHRIMVQADNNSIIPARFKEYEALDVLENNYEIRGAKDHWAMISLVGKILEHYIRSGGEFRIQETGEGEPALDSSSFDSALKFFKGKRLAILHSMKQAGSDQKHFYDKNILAILDGVSKDPHVKLIQLDNPWILNQINKNYKFKESIFADTKEKIFGKLAEKYINTKHTVAVEKSIAPDTFEEGLSLRTESIFDIIEYFKDKSIVVLDSQYIKKTGYAESTHQIFALYNGTFYKIALNNKVIHNAFKDLQAYNRDSQTDSQIGFFAKLFEKYYFDLLSRGEDVKGLLSQGELSPATVELIINKHFKDLLD